MTIERKKKEREKSLQLEYEKHGCAATSMAPRKKKKTTSPSPRQSGRRSGRNEDDEAIIVDKRKKRRHLMNDYPELANLLGFYLLEIRHYDGDIWIAGPNRAKFQLMLACTSRAFRKGMKDTLSQFIILEGLSVCGPRRSGKEDYDFPRWKNKCYPGPLPGVVILYSKKGKKPNKLKTPELWKILRQLVKEIPDRCFGAKTYNITRWISLHGLKLRVTCAKRGMPVDLWPTGEDKSKHEINITLW